MSVVTATVVNAKAGKLDPVHALHSIDNWREVNRIPYANLVLLDGDAAARKFALSDKSFFAPGEEIEIKLRYESVTKDATLFKGKVVRHRVEAGNEGSLLRIELKDAAVKLTQPRRSAVFRDQSDADLVGQLLRAAGVAVGAIASTEPRHAEILQYECSDWDFIVSRADVNGLLAVVEDGKVSLRKVDLNQQPKHHFDFGISELYDFEFELDASHQAKKVTSRGWSVADQKLSAPASAQDLSLQQGNLGGAKLAGALGFGDRVLTHPVPMAPKELQAWADARMARSRLSMLRGRVSMPGFAKLALLDMMKIDGVGKRFNGKTVVTGLCHRVDIEGWRTDVQFGLSARAFCVEDDIRDAPAAGLLPAVGGLHIGIVDAYAADPDKQMRVKLRLPTLGARGESVWARLASPDAGKDRGYSFRPEPGDEVVVGFFNQDPRQPVILGALYSSKNTAPPAIGDPTDKNRLKGIVTRGGTRILFNDADKPSLSLETAAGNRIVLDDDKASIAISDQHGNAITMDKNGIELKSAKDLKLTAQGKVQIEGSAVDVQ